MSRSYILLAAQGSAGPSAEVNEAAALLLHAGWKRAFRQDRLEVWTHGGRGPAVLWREVDRTLLIGVAHSAIGNASDTATRANPNDAGARAERLCARSWGSYVAVFQTAGSSELAAFRDPSGTLDAVTWSREGVDILASGLRHIPSSLQPPRLALDWHAITDFVRRPAALAGRTGFAGLATLAPGDLRPVGEEGVSRAVWRPLDRIVDAQATPQASGARLAEVVRETVQALAAPYRRILSEASGGLDSSIVNACLAAGGRGGSVAAVLHYVGDRMESDERAWARQLCERWSLPLTCARREVGVIDPDADFGELARDLRPPVAALDSWRDRDVTRRLERYDADALLTGMGGDASLFQMPTTRVLSDLWRARGIMGLGDPAWRDVPRWLRRSVWSTGAEALRMLRRGSAIPVSPFAGERAREPDSHAAHPWLEGVQDAPPGKRLQIEAFAGLQMTLGPNRRAEGADVLHPLLAQPVMEVCLAIPSWILVQGGRDRGLARDAFADILPPGITQRRSKGSLTSLFSRRVAASLEVLRPYLLDGVLAGAGVLDRPAMEAALNADRLIWRSDGLPLVRAAAIEAWVRHWQARVPDAAQASRHRR